MMGSVDVMSSAQEIDLRVIDFDFTDMTWSTVDYSEKPALQVRCQRGWQQTGENIGNKL